MHNCGKIKQWNALHLLVGSRTKDCKTTQRSILAIIMHYALFIMHYEFLLFI